jgi:hypothetical protein
MQYCSCSVKYTDTTWWISGDVCHISIVLFCGYANHICISHTARINYEDECDSPPTIRTLFIFGKKILLMRNIYGRYFAMNLHFHVHK